MSHPASASRYFVPQPSYWPLVGSCALLLLASGAVLMMNSVANGGFVVLAGFAVLTTMLFGWFGRVIGESEGQRYNLQVDRSFRWAMSWFIFSEVMFFVAFFGALFYIRVLSIPDLASPAQAALWEGFQNSWPSAGPAATDPFSKMHAWGIPAINTLLLLTSGATLTWAHWGLVAEKRSQLIIGLVLTIALGVLFLGLQVFEYAEAYGHMNLKMTTGVYGSTFFMLTGFHGFHVTLGVTMLTVILFRVLKGHFTAERHFAFEGVAWYWHFVDVVWLGLFIVIYWL
ncbi:MAG: Cytochrome c oxidase subunit 3 [Candidatus Accumulibacter regalis]|mgnify:FL=1|jgi:cytochrome c oxidase subunit 3|uniref:cytochrome-c oxidase n=1 Tax=Accumulibacter regalis TaxID=522306 RepID=A0A011PV66_ACCRE|nr:MULTISPECIES: cytochrome c oxidase subunit 3 [unclassified Candidatus Accumulibacter]EXI91286.1 MAG: Cytochrome c oxidase subunit 3 [Candidatus Accumulibacter regalis]MQM33201.1 cytochrome c oxidase subunit 3 [Candidatus Accumulibacter phosphatis]MBL8369377.1 cytochrome c oxidase subunit 3 [Accumulibacter sp.]MBN8515155.1 cytochrome c oxidase subunit 3 [Accumulibacter sp.]HRE70051.1 cytochrome c oxidase subunit 3 [Accumulibacter sp.]